MRSWLALPFIVLFLAGAARAEVATDALPWLQRIAEAARKLDYQGTFIYQRGQLTEVFRISHRMEGGSELERIEVLDGSQREVLRHDDEIRCFLPESHLMIVERRNAGRQTFPSLLSTSLVGLTEHYSIRKGATRRVAGFESQAILITPKDDLRYGHEFWVDVRSGLLLRASLMDERGEPLETFTFTELRVGEPVDRAALMPRLGTENKDWTVRNVRTVRSEEVPWLFRAQLPGFRKRAAMRRQASPEAQEVLHVIFSDGLAAISVFIEPFAGARPETGPFAVGAVNAYKRVIGSHLLVAMGDVPLASLKKLLDGVEPKQK